MLAIMKLSDVAGNYKRTTEILDDVTEGNRPMVIGEYEKLVRMNQDLHDRLVELAEVFGKTNVRGSQLRF